MLQRFFIRLIIFTALSIGGAFLLVLLFGETKISSWLIISVLLLCIIYSGRWVAFHLGPAFHTLLRYGFIALLFGSVPGIIVVLILMACLFQVITIAVLIVGIGQILRELLEALRMDRK